MKSIALYLFIAVAFFTACSGLSSNPEKLFTTIGLNSNKIPVKFKRAFDEIRGQRRIGNLKVYSPEKKDYIAANAQEYVASNYQHMFDEDIQKVKELSANEETQPIIDAALVMFQYADEVYKNDYPKIAKMIDDGVADDEVNAAIADLDATKGVELTDLREKMLDLLLPYVDKKGVEYKTLNMP